jgi:hypothetical protein
LTWLLNGKVIILKKKILRIICFVFKDGSVTWMTINVALLWALSLLLLLAGVHLSFPCKWRGWIENRNTFNWLIKRKAFIKERRYFNYKIKSKKKVLHIRVMILRYIYIFNIDWFIFRLCTVKSGICKHEYGLKCCFRFLKKRQNIHWSQ